MTLEAKVLKLLDDVLSLGGRTSQFHRGTPLLGSIAELDSMAVVTLLTSLEEKFGFTVDDDEVDGDMFVNVGTLTDFVARKLADA